MPLIILNSETLYCPSCKMPVTLPKQFEWQEQSSGRPQWKEKKKKEDCPLCKVELKSY